MAAPKGNKYAEGNDGGRPALYDNADTLQANIDEYFEKGRNTRTVIVGKYPNKESIELPVYTITGLSLYLGFESRQSFYDYELREEFSYIIKRARLRIENEYEEQLQYGNTAGAIFALKNMDWRDRSLLDIGGQKNNPLTHLISKPLEKDELKGFFKELEDEY